MMVFCQRACVAVFLAIFGAGSVFADDFTVQDAELGLINDVYHLNSRVDYRFNQQTLDALGNGVPVIVLWEIEILKERPYVWSDTVAHLEQRYELRLLPLTRQYLITNLNTGGKETYVTLDQVRATLGNIINFPILDKSILEEGQDYSARFRVSLDIESLPVPLRLLAYVSPGWDITSEWYTWALPR